MKKALLIIVGIILTSTLFTAAYAQEIAGIYERHISENRKPVPYQYVREADVAWSKIIWRRVVLTEKNNLPLYYPVDPMSDRKSLVQLMMWGIMNKSLTPFESDEFSKQFTVKEINNRFGAGIDTIVDIDPETGERIEVISREKANYGEIKEMLVKEMWFFDKQRSVMDVRIIGIAPIRIFFRDDDLDQVEQRQSVLFWIYYPEARNVFASQPIYNPDNQASEISFDDIFFKRKFNGYVYKESNVYENRRIEDYTSGLEVLLESERIKEEIFNFESDLWQY